jgi:DNA-binding response OmpR family regulator
MKILVVEDDPATRAIVKRVASSSATQVFEAENGLDALAIIETEDPDLLITDLHLPLLDGFELVTALRASAANSHLPVICVSVINARADIQRLPALRIDDYLLKPVNPTQLNERIKRVLQKDPNWRSHRIESAKPPTVLIVDSDPAFAAFVRPLLGTGYEVLEAASGPAALTTFKELATKPGVVILAAELPMLGGTPIVEVLNRLCDAAAVPAPVVLSLSASPDPTSALPSGYAGIVRRTLVAAEFTADTEQWLPKREAVVPSAPAASPDEQNAPLAQPASELVPS